MLVDLCWLLRQQTRVIKWDKGAWLRKMLHIREEAFQLSHRAEHIMQTKADTERQYVKQKKVAFY